MEFKDVVYGRRSVRDFDGTPVEREKITEMLKAAMAGPSAENKRPWQFLVVDEGGQLDNLRDALKYGKYNYPAAVVVLGDAVTSKHYWHVDGLIAATNLCNAAADLGVDSIFIGLYPFENEWTVVQEHMGLAENIKPVCVIGLGYGKKQEEPRTQYEETRVHWNQY